MHFGNFCFGQHFFCGFESDFLAELRYRYYVHWVFENLWNLDVCSKYTVAVNIKLGKLCKRARLRGGEGTNW